MSGDDVFSALQTQTDKLDAVLSSLTPDQWKAPSLCSGWDVSDVVLHLAQTEEGVLLSIQNREIPNRPRDAATVDDVIEHWVAQERGDPPEAVHERWDRARRAALEALRSADPATPVPWIAASLRPRTLATTRLSEHWIHTKDITDPLGIEDPDTDDIKHLAWLAVKTIPYAFARSGRNDPPTVRAELVAPSGERWVIGPADAACVITGPASEFVRVAARRLAPGEATRLTATGDKATDVVELLRTYA